MFKYFKNLFCRYKLEIFIKNSYFFDYIDILDKYDKFEYPSSSSILTSVVKPINNKFFATRDKDTGEIDIYYRNIRIHLVNKEDNKMIQIFLKKQNDNWVISKKNEGFDYSSPLNVNVEIYRWYNFVYMNDRNYSDEKFLEGTWNEKVLDDLKSLDNEIRMITDEAQVSSSYIEEKEDKKKEYIPSQNKVSVNDGYIDDYTI